MKRIDSKAGEGTREARLQAVRRALREGDPAAEPQSPGTEPEATPFVPLSPEEIVVMRATMLCAVPDERRMSPRLLPILVGSALTLVGWGVLSLVSWLGRLPIPGEESAPRVATSSIPAETPGSVSGDWGPGPGGPNARSLPSPSGVGIQADVGAPSPPERSSRRGSASSGSAHSPRAVSPRPGLAPSVAKAPAAQLASAGSSTLPSAPNSALGAEPVAVPSKRELQFSTPGGTRIVWVFASGDAPVSETPRPARL
jgi:hypothetical protein